VIAPTCSAASTRALRLTSSVMPVWSNFLKPVALISTL
jgi:hypothetical protein